MLSALGVVPSPAVRPSKGDRGFSLDEDGSETPGKPICATLSRRTSASRKGGGSRSGTKSPARTGSRTPHSRVTNTGSSLDVLMYPSEKVAREAVLARFGMFAEDGEKKGDGVVCQITFRRMVILSIVFCVVAASSALVASMFYFAEQIQLTSTRGCDALSLKQSDMITELIDGGVTEQSFSDVLSSIESMVTEYVKSPADSALDSLLGSMETKHYLDETWIGKTEEERAWVTDRAFIELAEQWNIAEGWIAPVAEGGLGLRRAADVLTVIFSTGEMAGVQISRSDPLNPLDCSSLGTAPVYCGSCYGKGMCESVIAAKIDAETGTDGTTERNFYLMNITTGEADAYGYRSDFDYETSKSYAVQAEIAANAERSPGGATAMKALRVWSEVHFVEMNRNTGYSKMTWTAPLAYCGDYSCFQGSIGADVVLRYISTDCASEWSKLAALLSEPRYNFTIGADDSSVFIVHHTSHFPDQEGLLIGASNDINGEDAGETTGRSLLLAQESPNGIVRDTSEALLRRFETWNATALQEKKMVFNFSLSNNYDYCDSDAPTNTSETDCWEVGTLSMKLDEYTRWLIVVVVPQGAFDKRASDNEKTVNEVISDMQETASAKIRQARQVAIWVFIAIVAFTASLGGLLGCFVSHGLSNLSAMMHGLGKLDISAVSNSCGQNKRSRHAMIKDIAHLEEAFSCLLDGVEAFTKFVPESVVKRIVKGDPKATRLHVKDHEVTCMFAVISDFGSICENLSEDQAILVMRRYHKTMMEIVKRYQGMVTEILDDGLLVYWNMPDDPVKNHPAEACRAALAQVKAMAQLNESLKMENSLQDLPELKLQIGFHTGTVLAGNLGSNMKMKFGSLGDAINLASRLMCLCKHWGVSIICSGETADRLPEDLLKRELALVKVKGKKQATRLYEVVGRDVCPMLKNMRVSFGTQGTAGTHESSRASPRGLRRVGSMLSWASPSVYTRRSVSKLSSRRSDLSGTGNDDSPQNDSPRPKSSPPTLSNILGPSIRSGNVSPSTLQRGVSVTSEPRSSSENEDGGRSDFSDINVRVGGTTGTGGRSGGPSPRSSQPMSRKSGLGGRAVSRRSLQLPGMERLTARLGSTLPVLLGGSSPNEDRWEDDLGEATSDDREFVFRYEEALRAFQNADFVEAHRLALELVDARPHDKPSERLLERLADYITTDGFAVDLTEEEKDNWTGVYVMTNK